MPQVVLDGARKRFGGTDALAGIDLRAEDGELLVVVGPSGCGKTTLLRAVAGLEALDEGRILIGERDVTRVRPAARNVSMVFQSYALFPHLTVEENIGFGLVVREVPKRVVREKVEVAAELVDCTGLLDRRPSQLSGGERQRVALARALVREPDAFLLDEPLSNLDAGLRAETRSELKRLHARVGATMLYVTHDQVEALTLGDRVAVMDAGRIRQVGTPDDVFLRPVDRFVARFLGAPSMNLVSPRTLDLGGVGEGVEVGIRPEHLRFGSGVEAEVTLVEPVGSEAFVHLRVGEEELVARVDASTRPGAGRPAARRSRPRGRAPLRPRDREAGGLSLVERRQHWLMLAPYAFGLVVLVALPALVTFALAFTEYDLIRDPTFIGVDNFRELAGDDIFRTALVNSLVFALVAVPLRLLAALGLALLLHPRFRERRRVPAGGRSCPRWCPTSRTGSSGSGCSTRSTGR